MHVALQPTAAHPQRLPAYVPPRDTTGRPQAHPLEALESLAATVCAERDGEIHAQGSPAEYCYRILSGCVRTVKLMEDGRRQVGEFLLPGDAFGFDAVDEHDFSAEAVTSVVLRRYPLRGVEVLADRDPGFARRLRALTVRQLQGAREQLVLLGRKTAAERIASFLLRMGERIPKDRDGRIDLPMGRADIADHLGLTIETVCRTLTSLRRDEVIDMSRARLVIRDRVGLHDLACETAQ